MGRHAVDGGVVGFGIGIGFGFGLWCSSWVLWLCRDVLCYAMLCYAVCCAVLWQLYVLYSTTEGTAVLLEYAMAIVLNRARCTHCYPFNNYLTYLQ